MHHPTDRIAHNTAFVTPVVRHWLERELARLSVSAGLLDACRVGMLYFETYNITLGRVLPQSEERNVASID